MVSTAAAEIQVYNHARKQERARKHDGARSSDGPHQKDCQRGSREGSNEYQRDAQYARAPPHRDRDAGAQRAAARDAESVRIGEGVTEEGLECGPRQSE